LLSEAREASADPSRQGETLKREVSDVTLSVKGTDEQRPPLVGTGRYPACDKLPHSPMPSLQKFNPAASAP